ncbi:MAG: hypothetical protein KBS45_02205, partial [Clostridiales bacterium]|nr:hypothetical protein [Candidatus Coliplasma caballi]
MFKANRFSCIKAKAPVYRRRFHNIFPCTHLGLQPAGDLVRGMQIGRSEPKQYMNIARVRIV